MSYTNCRIEIELGNVESRFIGFAPLALLHRRLNAHLAGARLGSWRSGDGRPSPLTDAGLVFDACRWRFLTGALPRVKRSLRDAGFRYRIHDGRHDASEHHPWRIEGYALRPYQQEIVERATSGRPGGLIDIGTGGGKTLLAAAIIAALGRPTLYLVTTRTLLTQTQRNLRDYLGIEPGTLGDGVWSPAAVTVGLIQSLAGHEHELTRFSGGTLVFDEGHHACARTYLRTICLIDARHNYFLSAVPFRSGSDQVVLDAITGGRLTDQRYSARYLIDHGYACRVQVRFERARITVDQMEKPFWQIYGEGVVRNTTRNARVATIARQEIAHGHSVLILVEQIEHGTRLIAELGGGESIDSTTSAELGSDTNTADTNTADTNTAETDTAETDTAFICGETPRRALRSRVDAFTSGQLRCLVATCGLFQEGISIDGIQALINAGGLKSRVKVLQAVGRGMRRAPGKRHVLFVDFLDDDTSGKLRGHSLHRAEILRREGFDVPPLPDLQDDAHSGLSLDTIPPSWMHIDGTERFALVTAEGSIVARGTCLERRLVPDRFCKRCDTPICEQGGSTEWSP